MSTDYISLKQIKLDGRHKSTGNTRHFRDGLIDNIAELKIMRYADAQGFYLLYLDSAGNELTDTYHESIEAAMQQAEWEFKVKPEEWKNEK